MLGSSRRPVSLPGISSSSSDSSSSLSSSSSSLSSQEERDPLGALQKKEKRHSKRKQKQAKKQSSHNSEPGFFNTSGSFDLRASSLERHSIVRSAVARRLELAQRFGGGNTLSLSSGSSSNGPPTPNGAKSPQQQHSASSASNTSLKPLRKACLQGKLKTEQTLIRHVVWMRLLGVFPGSLAVSEWPGVLAIHRQEYSSLRAQWMVDPHSVDAANAPSPRDSSHAAAADDVIRRPSSPDESPSSSGAVPVPVAEHPLATHTQSKWAQFHRDAELQRELRQDIERTYPGNEFFERSDIQSLMLRVLFVYAKQNPQLGYKQGMHEILAPVIWITWNDALNLTELADAEEAERRAAAEAMLAEQEQKQKAESDSDSKDLEEESSSSVPVVEKGQESLESGVLDLLDSEYIEHDSYVLFAQIMQRIKSWFVTTVDPGSNPNDGSPKNNNADMDTLTPVVLRCHHIHHNVLQHVDRPV
jgi:Rab-GTPase-TBC domain